MTAFLIEIAQVSALIWIILYGSFNLLGQFFAPTISSSYVVISATILSFYFARVKPVNKNVVEKVIGKDPLSSSSGSEDVVRVVAHRGACLDAPENSLTAFQMVRYCIIA